MKKLSLFLIALAMILTSCKPEIEKPTVVTKSVGEVTETTAKVVGQVTADGGAEVTERGVCWSLDGTPTILDYRVKDVEGGLGSYDVIFTDLVPNTQYYVRAYATNETGTAYGEEKTFTTLEVIPEEPGDEPGEPGDEPGEPGDEPEEPGDEPENPGDEPEEPGDEPEEPGDEPEEPGDEPENPGDEPEEPGDEPENPGDEPEEPGDEPENPGDEPEEPIEPEQPVGPVVITAEVTEITTNSAKCGGGISDGGGAAVIERGVCWNTSGNPTVLDFTTKDGSGLGSYISNITGLEHNTTYYVRAYAVNANGVAGYGPEVSFTTLNHEYVDLGLSVKWATCNVGATMPEEYGDYFAWGETTTKETYTEDNCLTWELTRSKLIEQGIIGYDGNLTPQYDAARANWGGNWRMPTYGECCELEAECTWTWTIQNGVNGYNVEGPNGNSIFLPAAGFIDEFIYDNTEGTWGKYWTSTYAENSGYEDSAYGFGFKFNFEDSAYGVSTGGRYWGRSVRPVLE